MSDYGTQLSYEAWRDDGAELLADMRHAIGTTGHRNHYCAETGSMAFRRWSLAVGMGLAKKPHYINDGKDAIFSVSDAGLALLRSQKAKCA